jgi:ribosomal protein S12 methylthiotransferase accessory factor
VSGQPSLTPGFRATRQRSANNNPTFGRVAGNEGLKLPFHLALAGSGGASDYCWGRASDQELAYEKAISEVVERSACVRMTGVYRARFDALEHTLDPRSVNAYEQRQYQRFGFSFARFDERRRVSWKDGVDHSSRKKVAILADLVFFERALGTRPGRRYTAATSSGVAAHPSEEKALELAVLELIERDAAMRAWLGHIETPRIPPAFLPRRLRQRLTDLERMGMRVAVKRLPSELAPVILVFAQHEQKAYTCTGTAAGFDVEDTLEHALMECESVAILRLDMDPPAPIEPRQVSSPSDHSDLYAQRRYFRRADFLAAGDRTTTLSAGGAAKSWKALLGRLEEKRLRLITVDLTPKKGARGRKVVRAIIPGLVPISFGYGLEPLGTFRGKARHPLFPHPFS